MQTFLPYSNFSKCAKVLDNKRLGKQRVEAMQILDILINNKKGHWSNHPAVLMWKGNEIALGIYGMIICREWINRGYKDTCLSKIFNLTLQALDSGKEYRIPKFLLNDKFLLSHKSNLLRKNYDHYSQFFIAPNDLPYVWPS